MGVAGCLHPDYSGYFTSPADYMKWYTQHGPLKGDASMPTVAVLLYRKHVITKQPYIVQLIRCMEMEGVRPVPIFINGIEAHTVVSTQPAGGQVSPRATFELLVFLTQIVTLAMAFEAHTEASTQLRTACRPLEAVPGLPAMADPQSSYRAALCFEFCKSILGRPDSLPVTNCVLPLVLKQPWSSASAGARSADQP